MIIWTLRRAEGRIEKQILYGKVLCSTPQFNSYPPHFTVLLHFTPTTLHYIITQHTTSQHTAQYNEAKQSTPLYTAHHTTPHHTTSPAPRASTEKACARAAQRPTGESSFQFSEVI
jgi:hypothetical protein